ncbi:TetR family transcriptional regulator C-terminal domain-containing protein [Mycolicibacterium sp.]|uniref:TetR family transcriptional regulator C-terminal domain-containing protein n=1 Tax=Mycolicibacterium sp. TaxID=2320850 RepID=UPI003D096FDC
MLAFLRGHAAELTADRRRRGCMLAKGAAELAATDDAVARAAERAYAIWQAELAGCIRQAQRDGDLDPAADPQPLAVTLLALLRGLEALHKGGARPADLAAATEQVIALIPRR